jgi:hypothetical protein
MRFGKKEKQSPRSGKLRYIKRRITLRPDTMFGTLLRDQDEEVVKRFIFRLRRVKRGECQILWDVGLCFSC